MLFDLRSPGRRRVIKVIYATLAVLMGGGLVLFGIGSDVQGGLFDAFDSGANTEASSTFDDQAEAIQVKLRRDPDNPDLLLGLVRTRYNAGNSRMEVDPETGAESVTPEARADFEAAADAWERYLRTKPTEDRPSVALFAANSFFLLAQTAASAEEAQADVAQAAAAQEIVADSRPSVGTYSTLAIYRYYALDFAGGDEALELTEKEAASPAQARQARRQLESIRKQAKLFGRQLRAERKAGAGKEALENPLGGLSGGGTLAPTAP